jgi:hypothetical protein
VADRDALGGGKGVRNQYSTQFQYDAVGNLTERTDRLGRLGRKIVYEYDNLYRNTADKWYDGANLVRTPAATAGLASSADRRVGARVRLRAIEARFLA